MTHPIEQFRKRLAELDRYPPGVVPVPAYIPGTAAFSGGAGLVSNARRCRISGRGDAPARRHGRGGLPLGFDPAGRKLDARTAPAFEGRKAMFAPLIGRGRALPRSRPVPLRHRPPPVTERSLT
jgi:hypothetical protein